MRLEFHPAVQGDLETALDYYEEEGGPHLADRFEMEFRACLRAIKAGPKQFSLYHVNPILRRVRLKSFPYLIVYREQSDVIRVTLLKHERRHPRFGMTRS